MLDVINDLRIPWDKASLTEVEEFHNTGKFPEKIQQVIDELEEKEEK